MKTRLLLSTLLFVLIFAPLQEVSSWGRVGHFITGEIAEAHMTDHAKAELQRVLGDMTMHEATVWMDQVRRTDEYSHTASWHWVTIPDGQTYEEAEKNPDGDIVEALERKITKLKEGGLSEDEERDAVLMVIHMIGDIHQPLHVGNGEDLGGNRVGINYMGRSTNLHSLWDTQMIVSWGFGPEEFAEGINLAPDELVAEWQNSTVRDWAVESVSYREDVYDVPDDYVVGWEYRNKNFHIVEKRLLQSGVRIAGVLNEIFSE